MTKSWWNDVWRDRLLAAMHFLANGNPSVLVETGSEHFEIAPWPLTVPLSVSYEATDPPAPSEEDEEGNIVPSAALDDQFDDLDDDDTPEGPDQGEGE